jgi:two-component sensor histidine kinase/integral membrane sensor domain MASE1
MPANSPPEAHLPDARSSNGTALTDNHSWPGTAGLAALLYLIPALGALALQSRPEGVAILWPASGLAAGLLLARGRDSLWPVAAGTLVATVAANLAYGRRLELALSFGMANALEAALFLLVMHRLCGPEVELQRLRHALRFLLAAAIACAVAAMLAAVAIRLGGGSRAPLLDIWRVWALSDYVGIVVIAPLVVAVAAVLRAPPRGHDWTGDIALLLLLSFLAWETLTMPSGSGQWQTLAPGSTVLPIALWLAARGQPIVPAAAMLIVGGLAATAAYVGVGRFGDPSIPGAQRVLAAQASLSALSLATLTMSALFHERRETQARLRESTERLATIASTTPGVMLSIARDEAGRLRLPFLTERARTVLGLEGSRLADDAGQLLDRLEPADRQRLLAHLSVGTAEVRPFQIELAYRHPGSGDRWLELLAAPAAGPTAGALWHGYVHDVTGRRTMTEELSHRTRNLLTVVQSVAYHTARHTDAESFADALNERMAGLLRRHDLLDSREWQGVTMDDLLRSQLSHLADLLDDRIRLDGPDVMLKPAAAQILGMAVHELATNAMKHGALAGPHGSVRLGWRVSQTSDPAAVRLTWKETGGPPTGAPTRKGFGHKVIVDMVGYQLAADVRLAHEPDGLLWEVEAPATLVLEQGSS